jgi:tetratricopeptide (TPR) repeat protein
MTAKTLRPLVAAALAAVVLTTLPLLGQYREYYFYGKVVDTDKKPVADVEIMLRDVETSRSYTIKSNKNGEFRFAGLPHGNYKVRFTKDGFAPKEDEWKFPTLQDTMQKVEVATVTLVSQELVQKTEKLKAMEAEIKSAAEKIRAKDYDGAIAQIKAFLEKNPTDINALYYLGISYARKKMFTDAIPLLARVLEAAPKFPPVYFELGVCYQQEGDKPKALELFQKNFELDPANEESAYDAGLILFGLSRIDEAKAVLEKALALRPDDPDALDLMSRCYINAGDYPKAIEYLEKAKAGTKDPDRVKFLDDLILKLKDQIKK